MSAATDQLTSVLNDCIKEREELRELNSELRGALSKVLTRSVMTDKFLHELMELLAKAAKLQ